METVKKLYLEADLHYFYFTHEYGLEYKSAFDSCSTEAEPSAKTVSELINEVKEKQIPVIYYEELTDPKISRSIK